VQNTLLHSLDEFLLSFGDKCADWTVSVGADLSGLSTHPHFAMTPSPSIRCYSPVARVGVIAIATVLALSAATNVVATNVLASTDQQSADTIPVGPETTTTTVAPTVIPTTIPWTTAPSTTVPITVTSTTIAPAPQNIAIYPDEIGNVMATIRYMESRGQYGIPPNRGNASGAYQFIGSTWASHGGYAHAYLAPPHIQDERAALDVVRFLEQWNNDVSMIPVMWYYPRASREPALMDVVPVPSAGNVLTIREYQTRWLGVFATISGQPVPQTLSLGEAVGRLGAPPLLNQRDDGMVPMAYPVLGPSRLATPDCNALANDAETRTDTSISRADIEAAGLCTAQAPAIIFGVKLQPIRAAADGVVTAVDDEPSSDRPITVTITATNGLSYIYAGFNDDNQGTADGDAPDHLRLTALAEVGRTVRAGQIIGFMGDTDPLPIGVREDVPTDSTVVIDPNAIAPHLRLSVIDVGGNPVDAFGPVVDALFGSACQAGIGQWSVPARSTSAAAVTVETTDNDKEVDSEWVITSTGQVQANGWAALISPNEQCTWVPAEPYGPGAGGSNQTPPAWSSDVNLASQVWVSLALAGDDAMPANFLRF
jgi:hypothetical protein